MIVQLKRLQASLRKIAESHHIDSVSSMDIHTEIDIIEDIITDGLEVKRSLQTAIDEIKRSRYYLK